MIGNLDHVLKVVIIGDTAVGKFTDGYFNEDTAATIGVDYKVKVMDVVGPNELTKRVKVTIWDTSGSERFRTLTSSYYRGSQAIILVYDVSRRITFDNLHMWLQEVDQFYVDINNEVVKVLVGNKVDLEREVTREEADEWAKARGMLFLEASAKTKEGIPQVFNEVVSQILQNPKLLTNTKPAKNGNNSFLNSSNVKRKKILGCC